MLENARRELGYAIYSATSGLYLQAFSNLRLFLELSFAAVYFSVNELLRRRWMADRIHFAWAKALEPQDGVLSVAFVREFHPTASVDAPRFAALAADCYKQCSQFIHGKMIATNTLPRSLQYSDSVMKVWIATATQSVEAVLYLLYVRYGEELLQHDDGRLAETLERSFQHLAAVRDAISLSAKAAN